MIRMRKLSWWYWLVTGVLLAGALWDWPPGFAPVLVLTLVHNLHYLLREASVKSFPVQVRIGYLLWMLIGLWGPFAFFHWIQLAGTSAAVLTDYCPMARMLSLLPWNRRSPLTVKLILRTFLQPPVPGSILNAT